MQAYEANQRRAAESQLAQIAFPGLLSGGATWLALKRAVEDLASLAPQDHDILIQVGDLAILEAEFVKPHTFLFQGLNQDGHRTWSVLHFSQLNARIIYLPKRGKQRVITGFSPALDFASNFDLSRNRIGMESSLRSG
jgi:hypothetical protein